MTNGVIAPAQFATARALPIRDGFGDALVELGKRYWNICAVSADLGGSLRLEKFGQQFPDRFFEVGVAEQNLIGVAAGLAKEGLVPFAGSFAAFSPGRTYDQIRVSVCYSGRNVKIVGGHGGLTVGPDGATHQMLEDIGMMRMLPGMTVLVPSDYASAIALTEQAAEMDGPVYLRLSRVGGKSLTKRKDIRLGQAHLMHEGNDLAILANGVMVDRALQLAYDLEAQGVHARVLNLHTVKPLDEEAVMQAAQETGRLVVIEEHQVAGGLGSAVAEFLVQRYPVPMELIGVNDQFGESGQADELLDAYGFSQQAILDRVKSFLRALS